MYEIHILGDEEFDKLPFKKVREKKEPVLGCADAKTGQAYVRRTGVSHLDRSTIEHEFDELLQSVSPHEEDGIRYKSGGSLGKILGPVLGSILTFAGLPQIGVPLGAAIAGGTQAHSQSVKPEKYGSGLGGIAKSAALGGIGSYAGGNLLKGGVAGFKGAAPGFFSKAGGAAKGALGAFTGAKPAVAAAPEVLNQAAMGIGQAAGGITAGAVPPGFFNPAAMGIGQAAGGSKLFGALNKFGKQAVKSAATNMLPNKLAPQGSTALSQGGMFMPGSSGGQSGALARFSGNPLLNISGDVGGEQIFQEDVDKGFANIDRNAESRRKSIFDVFRGQTPEGNTKFANQLANIGISTQREKNTFKQEALGANAKRNLGLRRDEFIRVNKLDNSKFDTYLNLARTGSDADITARFDQDPNEFRGLFKEFF